MNKATRSRGDRLAGLLLIRAGEAKSVVHFFVFFLLLGAGMALGRSTTDALFFKRYGIEYLPLMYVALSIGLCITSTLYAAYADRLPAERLFKTLLVAMIGLIGLSWALMTFTFADFVYPLYFLIYEIASELLLIHATLYLGQNFEILQAKRLSGLIMAGSQVGVIIGGVTLALIAPLMGVQNVLLVWSFLLFLGIVQIQLWHKRNGASTLFRRVQHKGSGGLGRAVVQVSQGLRYMSDSDLLRAASFALFFMVIAFYILCYSVNRIYTASFATEESLTSFFGILTAVNSSIALLLQLFVTNRAIARFGVKKINLVFPFTSFVSYGSLLASFSVAPALVGSFNKDAVMPAFRNPVRNVIFGALPSNMQGRARATSVVVVLPLALLVCGALLWFTQKLQEPVYFLLIGVAATPLYLWYSLRMNKAYGTEIIRHLKRTLSIPGGQLNSSLRGSDESLLSELQKGVRHNDPKVSLAFAKALLAAQPSVATETILQRAASSDHGTEDQLLKLLVPHRPKGLEAYLMDRLPTAEGHLRSTILMTLFQLGSEQAEPFVKGCLENSNPRLAAAGIFGALSYPSKQLQSAAIRRWADLLQSTSLEENLGALGLDGRLWSADASGLERLQGVARDCIVRNLGIAGRAQLAALRAIERWPLEWPHRLPDRLAEVYEDPDPAVRKQCIAAVGRVPAVYRDPLLLRACEDQDPQVREAAMALINDGSETARSRLLAWLTSENRGSPRSQQTVLANLQIGGLDAETMVAIALAKAKDAAQVASSLSVVKAAAGKRPALQLFARVLEERLQQIIDLALMAIQPLEEPETIAAIRIGLKSRDRRHVANACEGFRNLGNKQLTKILADLMEYFVHEHRDNASFADKHSSLAAALQWSMTRADPWLSRCAAYAHERVNEMGTANAGSV